MPDLFDNSDNLGIVRAIADVDTLSERMVAKLEACLYKRLHPQSASAAPFLAILINAEIAPLDERNSHRLEIAGADLLIARVNRFAGRARRSVWKTD